MKILAHTNDFGEMELIEMGQKYPNANFCRIELSINGFNTVYVFYEGEFDIATVEKELNIENLTMDFVVL